MHAINPGFPLQYLNISGSLNQVRFAREHFLISGFTTLGFDRCEVDRSAVSDTTNYSP
jgi:hypothetical protein